MLFEEQLKKKMDFNKKNQAKMMIFKNFFVNKRVMMIDIIKMK